MYCRGQLVQLQRDLPAIKKAGFGLAAISYDSMPVLRDFASRKNITYPLLADHESIVIRAFRVANRKYSKGTLLDVTTEQITNALGDVPVFGAAYPSVFVIDTNGKIAWRFVSEADELRLTGTAILEHSISAPVNESHQIIANERVGIVATASDTAVGLGNRTVIGIELNLPTGYHVYGPEVGHGYRGLDWIMDDSSCWYQNAATYPAPRNVQFAFEDGALPVYKGTIRITRELVLKPVLSATDPSLFNLFKNVCLDKAGNIRAKGKINLQVCDDRKCFPPQSVPLEWKFKFLMPDLERSPIELRREFAP
jgi:hypothetical protein